MSDRAVLVSVTPEFAAKIAAGTKTIELRRRFPEVPNGTWVYLYSTHPVAALLGRARVSHIDIDEPSELWRRHKDAVGVSRQFFDAYFAERDKGFAIQLTAYESLPSIALGDLRRLLEGFVAPQSFRYLDAHAQRLLTKFESHGADGQT